MPFLFVDYDQGVGGEYFCANLSQSKECVTLEYTNYKNQRTKVKDVFNQEFLKPNPKIVAQSSHSELYDVVPSHRNTELAVQHLKDVRSVRIANPQDPKLWQYVIEQRILKVHLSPEPNVEYFLGQLKILKETAVDPEFIRKVNPDMDVLSLRLLADGITPTELSRAQRLTEIKSQLPWAEPSHNYNCVIPCEDLFFNTESVKQKLFQYFGIKVLGNWLDQYHKKYSAHLT